VLGKRRLAAETAVAAYAQECEKRGIAREPVVVEGAAACAIVATVRLHCAGLISMGTHARRGLSRMFLGSVAERVAREAPVPVVVVRPRDGSKASPGVDAGKASALAH
jgi:nucleotide-binding universal stress UspA family protein